MLLHTSLWLQWLLCVSVALNWLNTLHILLIWHHLNISCSANRKKQLAGKQVLERWWGHPLFSFKRTFLKNQDESFYRAFSCDVMLSSNMVTSIATEINIRSCKHLFTLLCTTVSPWTSPFVVQAQDRVHTWYMCDCPGYPGQSVQSDGHVGGQHDVSENGLYHGNPSAATLMEEGCGSQGKLC